MSTTPLLAADRVRLYLTLVPYLLERGQVSLAEAAAEFGVETEQLRGMVEKLTLIGLPGDSGYHQMPGESFDINWDLLDDHDVIEITYDVGLRRVPRFTAREAAALLAGLQMIAAVPAVKSAGVVEDLIRKLSRGAADTPAEVLIASVAVNEVRDIVSQALSDGVAVSFTYKGPDAAETSRTVDPMKVIISDGEWYLQGWCHLRKAARTFNLDRVSEVHQTSIPITHKDTELPELFSGDGAEVVLRIPERVVPLVSRLLALEKAEPVAGEVIATTRLTDPRAAKRFVARFGGAVVVESPSIARSAVQDWAAAGLALYHQEHQSRSG